MKIKFTWKKRIPRLAIVGFGVTCMTLGGTMPSWGQMVNRESTDRWPSDSQLLVDESFAPVVAPQEFPAVSSEILQLISPVGERNCDLNQGRSHHQVTEDLPPEKVDLLQELNCVFLSSENLSEASLLQGLQVDYPSASSQIFPAPTEEANSGEMLAQRSYYDDDQPTLTVTPRAGVGGTKGIYGGLNFRLSNLGSNNGIIDLNLEGGEKTVGVSFSYTDPWYDEFGYDFGYRINVFNSRNPERNFLNGDREVNLIHDHTPWVDRLGAGIEFYQPVTDSGVILAYGANYQRVAVRNAGLTNKTFSRDQLGNRVTVGDDGMDPLFTLGVGLFQDRRDDPNWPTEGYRFRLSSEQSIPLGDDEITMNRLVGSYSQFLPMGDNTIAFGVKAGTIIGDAPPYQAFEIGGGNSVRGYGGAEVGSGRSFVTGAVEYRFLIADDLEWPFVSRLGGTFFFDYGTDLGSGDTVIGEPAEVRNKPGNGFGGGVGVRLLTTFGQVRGEFGMSDEGDFSFHVELGDRF